MTPTSTESPIAIKRQLAGMLREAVRRAGGLQISQFLDIEIGEEQIQAMVRSGPRIFDLTYNMESGDVSYSVMGGRNSARLDGFVEAALAAEEKTFYYPLSSSWSQRQDAAIKTPDCKDGIPCGEACIDPDETCRLKSGRGLTSRERQEVRQTAKMLKKAAADADPVKDRYTELTIRELQAQARERDVFRANHLSKGELKEQLRTLDKDPQSQEKLRKTLEKRRVAKREQEAVLQEFASSPAQVWKALQKVMKLSNTSPQTAAILSAALVASFTARSYAQLRDRYKSGLQESAQLAIQRADNIPLEKVDKENLTVAVGGFAATGSRGQALKDLLAPQDQSPAEQWFDRRNQVIAFEHPEFDIPPTAASKKNADGTYNPAYLGHVAVNGFGSYFRNLQRGRNDSAVDLAAQLYAYGKRDKKLNLNLLAHGSGGQVVAEAAEILQRMRSPDGKGPIGSDIVKRLNIVNLGTPHFGFANDRFWSQINHRTITSSNDPFSGLPKRLPQWISTVPGHEIADYLGSPEVRDRIRESFGYYTNSLKGASKRDKNWKERSKAIGDSLDKIGMRLPAQTWRAFTGVADRWKEDPTTALIEGGGSLALLAKGAYLVGNERLKRSVGREAGNAYAMVSDVARTIPSPGKKSNYLITVGGTGTTADALRQQLVRSTTDPSTGQSVYDQSHVPISFDPNARRDVPAIAQGKGPVTDAYVAVEGFGSAARQMLSAESDPDAARLAAIMYAAAERDSSSGKLPVNVVAYDTGGMTARRALEILKRMGPSGDDKRGAKYAQRVKLVTLGSPDFGISRVESDKGQLNLMGGGDTFSSFPLSLVGAPNPSIVPGVVSHSAEEYVRSPEVVEQLEGFFGLRGKKTRKKPAKTPVQGQSSPQAPPPASVAPPTPVAKRTRRKAAATPVQPPAAAIPASAAPPTPAPKRKRAVSPPPASAPTPSAPAPPPPPAATPPARARRSAPPPQAGGGVLDAIRSLGLPAAPISGSGDPRLTPGWDALSPEKQVAELKSFARKAARPSTTRRRRQP